MTDLLLKALLAYLLGSISGALLIGRLRGVDIRTVGSGNAGGTNALRTQGLVFALGVVVIDVGKGVLAAGALPFLPLGWSSLAHEPVAWSCGLAAVAGHIYPIYYGFRGGKGAATFVGAAGTLLPLALAPIIGLWIAVILATGYVGLATIIAAATVVPAAWWLTEPAHRLVVVSLATTTAVLIIHAHRENVRRLLEGTEHRFDKARVVFWFKRRGD